MCRLKGRSQAKQDSGQQGDAKGEGENGAIGMKVEANLI